jgi:hypothetical protein
MTFYPYTPKKQSVAARTGRGVAKMYKVALADADTAGGVLSLANPEGVALIVTGLVLDVTTAATGACTLDAGIAANGTTSNDTLIDGVDVNTAVITADNIKNAGTNGASARRWGATEYLTVSKASGAAAGLAGYAYVDYVIA